MKAGDMSGMHAWLILNIGSSTIKFAIHGADAGEHARGAIDSVGRSPRLKARFGDETVQIPVPDASLGTEALTGWLLGEIEARLGTINLLSAGHRVVHGGMDFAAPVVLTDDVIARLTALCPLAPGHQPYNLAGIRAVARRWPQVRQIACFDTAFHRTRPRLAQLYALPRALSDKGILRYGFHGLSYEYIAGRLPAVIGPGSEGRVIVAHLGSGASLCAMVGRKSVETTMGFGALDGLVMGTRAGQIDPGVLLHLMRTKGYDTDQLEALLSRQSGLLGISGISPDMRDLLASADPYACEAVALFVRSITRHIGALAAGMGGLDALIFTAGIGEHAPEIRLAVMEQLGWLGLEPDAEGNAAGKVILTQPESRIIAATIPTNEEAVILRALTDLMA